MCYGLKVKKRQGIEKGGKHVFLENIEKTYPEFYRVQGVEKGGIG